jgi:hypothetical protein
MNKSNFIKTPHFSVRGFAFLTVFVLLLASCGGSTSNTLTNWGQKRFGVSYDQNLFKVTNQSINELELKIDSLGDDFTASVSAYTTKLDSKVTREDYYESALNEFQSNFEKILNEVPAKLDLKGITTYTDIVTGAVTGKQDNWQGMLKLIIMDDAVMVVTIKGDATKIQPYLPQIRAFFDSAFVKGEND